MRNKMFTETETTVLLNFLDRVPITGHQERSNMNHLVQKLMTPTQDEVPEDTEE